MPSIRRTTRLTTAASEATKPLSAPVATTKPAKPAPRGYVAINMSLDSRTDMVEMTARKDMVIDGEHGASVSLKAGEKFTAVRAASLGEDMWYIVRHVSGMKKCSCAANKPCRHEIAVAEQAKKAEPAKVVEEPASHMMSEAVWAKLASMQDACIEEPEKINDSLIFCGSEPAPEAAPAPKSDEIFSELKKSSQSLIFSRSEVAPQADAALKNEVLKKSIGSTVAKAKSMMDAPLTKNSGFSLMR